MKDRRSFYRNYPTIKFSKGETIFYQDEIPKNLYCVKSGVVEGLNFTADGNSQTVSFEVVGGIIPKCWAFSKTSCTLFYYRAYTDCELYIIDKKTFLRQLEDNIEFTNKMIDRTMSSLVGARLLVDALGKNKAYAKLLYIFRYLSLLYGKDINGNFVRIQIPLTQQTISNIAGLTRETTSIELNLIKKQNIVMCKRKIYTINIKELNDHIDDDYNPGVNIKRLIN